MQISLIVAMDRNRGIGYREGLPWRLPADLRHFRELTMGHHLLLGRRTYDSIGRPLPGRRMIVLTRNPGLLLPEVDLVTSIDDAIDLARRRGETQLFIGGGAEIYALALPITHRICLTEVDASVPADTFCPQWNPDDWAETERLPHPADEHHQYPFAFVTLLRRNHQ